MPKRKPRLPARPRQGRAGPASVPAHGARCSRQPSTRACARESCSGSKKADVDLHRHDLIVEALLRTARRRRAGRRGRDSDRQRLFRTSRRRSNSSTPSELRVFHVPTDDATRHDEAKVSFAVLSAPASSSATGTNAPEAGGVATSKRAPIRTSGVLAPTQTPDVGVDVVRPIASTRPAPHHREPARDAEAQPAHDQRIIYVCHKDRASRPTDLDLDPTNCRR